MSVTSITVIAVILTQVITFRQCVASAFRQIPYSQDGRVVGKLTQAYTWTELGKKLFGALGGAASFSYRDPDTQDEVKVIVGVDPLWNRIVWSTSYHGETRISDFGTFGAGATQMNSPGGLALGSNGNLYIADTGNGRVKVFGWTADYIPNAERFFGLYFNIPGGSDFTCPDQVAWDDNGTDTAVDDVCWVLDRMGATIVGYHITLVNSQWSYSLYVRIPFKEIFQGPSSRYLTSMTKARSYSSPSEFATNCTQDLIVFDATNDCFLRLTIPHTAGVITTPASQITLTTIANPQPGIAYTKLMTDGWGNILALDEGESKLYKFSRTLQLVGSYGSRGTGGLGTEQMLSPQSLMFHIDKPAPGEYGLSKQALLAEKWSDETGIQGLEALSGVDLPDVTLLPNSWNVKIGVNSIDDGHLRVRILDTQTGALMRTLADQDVNAGRSEFIWNGNNDAGAPVNRCTGYVAEARITGFYSSADTAKASTSFYYKPPMLSQVRINTNVPGAHFSVDGRDTTIAGNFAVYPCSLCTIHSPRAPAQQTIASVKYCFDRWSNGGFRTYHNIQVLADSTVTLFLTAGPGPTNVPAGATLYDDAFDCKSPYIFLGSATLTSSSPTDTFRTWGEVKFRFPKSVGAALTVNRPFKATGARFESVDSTANPTPHLWEGLRLATYGSLFLDTCFVRNAEYGVQTLSGCALPANVSIERSSFDNNRVGDLSLGFDWSRNPTVRLVGNAFHSVGGVGIGVTGITPSLVGTVTIQNNFFYTATPNAGDLTITGGWSGLITGNTFTVNQGSAIGLLLNQYVELGPCGNPPGPYASPSVGIHNNKFNITAGSNRLALKTPAVTSVVTQIDALNNDWSYYTADQIRQVIVNDGTDGGPLAIAQFQPFTAGGGGGGGGGGCPFVLTDSGEGLMVENSLLGRSLAAGTDVSDAYPLRASLSRDDGRVRLRIAELGVETDEIDEARLASILVPDGFDVGSDGSGRPILFKAIGSPFRKLAWTGKDAPFISPIAPGEAYRGGAGDSLDFGIDSDGSIISPGKRRIGISLIPKPPGAGPSPRGSAGVTIRVSPDAQGNRWFTLEVVLPRENWSPELIPLDALGDLPVRRVRVIWHTAHTLGWISVASGEPAPIDLLPCLSARHSNGRSVLAELGAKDAKNVTVLPGEHVELEFDASRVPPDARLVLLTHGRYFRTNAATAPVVPKIYSLGQNRPNPFNPETQIAFGLPAPSHATLRVYNVIGRLVRTIIDRDLPAGYHTARWEGRDEQGRSAASGVYFYELRAGSFMDRRRMVLLR